MKNKSRKCMMCSFFFFFQAEDGIRDRDVTGVQTCALPILPSDGVSRSPRIESKVVLPQPDGPAIETYSPVRISRWIPERACVSTSSVRKTFLDRKSVV